MINYELHIEGFSMECPFIPEDIKGNYLAICHPKSIEHFKRLSVDSLQIMPIFNSVGTYWGYDPISWIDTNPRYGTISEFQEMVDTLHDSGIKVILDVVYNHTANGYSIPGVYHYDWDVTGCGNTVDVKKSIDAILESMTYWLRDIGVDGMRFDLANVLGRENSNFNPCSEFFIRTEQFNDKIFIAEPWDCSEVSPYNGYPDWWIVLNGQWRDSVRSNKDTTNNTGRPDTGLMNFVTCHDGLTMYDLVHKLQDYKGTEESHFIHSTGFWNALMNSEHCLILSGDEMGNSQNGENNTYLLGNHTSWVNWDKFSVGT